MPKKIIFPAIDDAWDSVNNRFIAFKEQTLIIEHSLISISKWESIWKKPFLSDSGNRTIEEWISYVKCMTLNNVTEDVYLRIDEKVLKEILDYIDDPMSATKVYDLMPQKGGKQETITSEVVYYSIFSFGIPKEVEKWHFNRLVQLLKVFSAKSDTRKMSSYEAASYQHALNESRRKKHR